MRYKTELTLTNEAMATWIDDGMITIWFMRSRRPIDSVSPYFNAHFYIERFTQSKDMRVADNILER